MIKRTAHWIKRKFFTKNFLKYAATGLMFTIINTAILWIFIDFIVLFPKRINTPAVTFISLAFLFILRYLVFQWIGFTKEG